MTDTTLTIPAGIEPLPYTCWELIGADGNAVEDLDGTPHFKTQAFANEWRPPTLQKGRALPTARQLDAPCWTATARCGEVWDEDSPHLESAEECLNLVLEDGWTVHDGALCCADHGDSCVPPPPVGATAPATFGNPRYDRRDDSVTYAEQDPAAVRWSLAWGACLSFGPDNNGGPMLVHLSISDKVLADAGLVREVTVEQVHEFAHNLLALIASETGPLRCRTNNAATRCEPATALINGEPRCDFCAGVIEERGPVDRQPLPGRAVSL